MSRIEEIRKKLLVEATEYRLELKDLVDVPVWDAQTQDHKVEETMTAWLIERLAMAKMELESTKESRDRLIGSYQAQIDRILKQQININNAEH